MARVRSDGRSESALRRPTVSGALRGGGGEMSDGGV